jgi:hypothetical protein
MKSFFHDLNLKWISPVSVICISTSAFAGAEKIPPLQPPRGELPPTFWEAHGWAVAFGVVAAALLVELGILWLRRPQPAHVTPPEVLARRALEALRARPEDGELLVKVSRTLRWYVLHALGLPPGELTTAELQRALASRPDISAELAGGLGEFLRQCDERKFSPAPPPAPKGAVVAALEWVDRIERQHRPVAPPAGVGSGAAAAVSSST